MTELFALLSTLFIALKLTNQIDWSWWWLPLPLLATAFSTFVWFIAINQAKRPQ
jgi:hypothetical protein